jgi:1,4-dihydroxy-2-naphthoyl-CoA synthase
MNTLYTVDQALQFKEHKLAHLLYAGRAISVLTLTLNRPEKKNALNPVLFKDTPMPSTTRITAEMYGRWS